MRLHTRRAECNQTVELGFPVHSVVWIDLALLSVFYDGNSLSWWLFPMTMFSSECMLLVVCKKRVISCLQDRTVARGGAELRLYSTQHFPECAIRSLSGYTHVPHREGNSIAVIVWCLCILTFDWHVDAWWLIVISLRRLRFGRYYRCFVKILIRHSRHYKRMVIMKIANLLSWLILHWLTMLTYWPDSLSWLTELTYWADLLRWFTAPTIALTYCTAHGAVACNRPEIREEKLGDTLGSW